MLMNWRPARCLRQTKKEGLLWLLLCGVARSAVCWRLIDLRHGDFLLVVHSEEQVVAETVTPMNTPPFPVVIHVSALRQPHLHIALGEFHWPILDVRMIGDQSDLRHGSDQIRF